MNGGRWWWLRVLLSVAALGLVIAWLRHDVDAAWHLIRHASWWMVVAAVGLYLCAILLISERFRRVLAAYGVRISLAAATRLSMIGLFFNNFLPSSIGGDVMKAHCAGRVSRRRAESYLAVLADRLLGLMTMAALGGLTILAYQGLELDRRVLMLGVIGVSGGAVALWHAPRLLALMSGRWAWLNRLPLVQRLPALTRSSSFTTGRLATVLLLSVAVQVLSILAVFVLARGLALSIPLGLLALIMPIIWLVSLLPSLNGLGLREGAFVYFLGHLAGRDGAFALSMLWLAVITAVSLLGALAYLASHTTEGEATS